MIFKVAFDILKIILSPYNEFNKYHETAVILYNRKELTWFAFSVGFIILSFENYFTL